MSNTDCASRFSVIIVNYNGAGMLAACLRSVLNEGVPAGKIVVVDNGSHDDSLVLAEQAAPGVRLIGNTCNAGFARAVNQGLDLASGDFVLLLNNDAQLEANSLCAFAEAFDQIPAVLIAGGQLYYPDGRPQNAVAAIPSLAGELLPKFLLNWLKPQRLGGKSQVINPAAVESVIGACLAVRRAGIAHLGRLDEDYFFFLEETEWCQRARRLGYRVYHVPAARAVHAQGQTANHFRSAARIEFQRSKLTFFRKTQGPLAYLIVSAILPIKALVNAASNSLICIVTLCLRRRQRARTLGYWRIVLWHGLGRPKEWGLPNKCPRLIDRRERPGIGGAHDRNVI
ncbi:MAG TPA: glycosyltransferase family 2 protein [Acidiferrobacter sp.]|nr:glycosyltransferase family 2 protein [Acidiferrobacter sp.]